MRTDWSVRLEFEGDPTEEQLLAIADEVDRYAGAVGGGVVGRTFGIRIAIDDARSGIDAVREAESIGRTALGAAGMDASIPIIAHEAQTIDELLAEEHGVHVDALVGLSEVARVHGFSRQRAHELSRYPSFPTPVAKVGRTPVWRLVDVERWLAIDRRPGRPKKIAAKATPSGLIKKSAAKAAPKKRARVARKPRPSKKKAAAAAAKRKPSLKSKRKRTMA